MTHAFIGEQIDSDSNPLWCEQCGEAHQTIRLSEAGLCDDCFAETMRETLSPILGYRPCAAAVWQGSDNPALCLEVSGVEHDHCGTR
jgi:protein-arginine kinase activator protein McsA